MSKDSYKISNGLWVVLQSRDITPRISFNMVVLLLKVLSVEKTINILTKWMYSIHIPTTLTRTINQTHFDHLIRIPREFPLSIIKLLMLKTHPSSWGFYRTSLSILFITLIIGLLVVTIETNLFIIFFQSCQVFTSFRKFTFFHTFANIPVNKSSFGVHQIELMIKP